jgi:hypothetical protein
MGILIGLLTFGVATLAACAWMRVEGRRNEREFVEAVRESAERRAAAAAEFAFQQQFADVLGQADYFCRCSAHERGLLLPDDLAERYPSMPQRPGPPVADPAEPWQLNLEAGADE